MDKNTQNLKLHGSRREFVKLVMLSAMAAGMPLSFISCHSEEARHFRGTGIPPYKVWEEMLFALQSCPDYLEGRSNLLIKAKNPEAMFHFVRDEIFLMPASDRAFGNIGSGFKWGITGILRYGMATPREKAELLCQMYNQAGIPAKVVFERTNIQPEEAKSFFLRPIQRKLDVAISEQQLNQWKKDMQADSAAKNDIPLIDADFSKANALAETLWNFIPENESLKMPGFDFRWDNYRTPTVEFIKDGETKYAHLFDPEVPFGELKNQGNIAAADNIRLNEETVDITITYREAIHPEKEIELISGSWKARDLVGNQLRFSCLNGLSLEQSAVTPLHNLRIFTPTLAFQDFDASVETMQQQSVIGPSFTLEGQKIAFPESDVDFQNPVVVLPSNATLLKTVTKVDIKATPANNPLVRVKVYPCDASGKLMEGLSVNDFIFTDNGNPVQALMESNQKTPRILILFDSSFSMPKEFFAEEMDFFITYLQEEIRAKYPAAIVDKWATPSELFTWLLKASKTSYDLIVFATDGDNEDSFNEKDLASYKNGPPSIILNVNKDTSPFKESTFQKMAAITNGIVLKATEQQTALQKITAFVNDMDIPPYSFTYYAGNEQQHELVLQMDEKRLEAQSNFSFEVGSTSLNQGIVGIYLNLKTKNTNVRRVLAGWDALTQKDQHPDETHFREAKSLILGNCTFYFEGEGPTLTASFVDLLKYKLSTRSWGEALLEGDLTKAKTEFEKDGYVFHADSIPLMAPIEEGITKDSFTFASGIRIGIFKEKFQPENRTATASFDYLPTSAYVSFSANNQNSFQINLQKTAQLSIREATIYSTSTYSELHEKMLIERNAAITSNWFREIEETDVYAGFWYERIYRGDGNYKIVDKSRASKAYWQINKQGELYGILKDGTGGGSTSIEQQLKELNFVMDYYMAVFTAMGVANMSVGIVATYGKTLVKLYAIVTEVIIVMDNTGMEDKVTAALKELACNVNKEIMFFALGGVGEIMGGLDLMISLMGGDGLPGLGCG